MIQPRVAARTDKLASSATRGTSSVASTRSPSPALSSQGSSSELSSGQFAGVYTVVDLEMKFIDMDVNRDGYLNFEEMCALLRSGNPDVTDEELQLIWRDLDLDSDGSLDFDEFLTYMLSRYPSSGAVDWAGVDKMFAHLASNSVLRLQQFTDLCIQCHLYDPADFGPVEAAALFTKVKKRGAPGLSERQFKTLLKLVAKKKTSTVETIAKWVGSFVPGLACKDIEASRTACWR
eukprot:gb/GFBE01074865.1/.p1 GENE.gb/GFBE01074865.1/~~gb/GFBE01074865.1/.p1  ORF type:complete len:234 (+),score=41.95 gb/GFBE01074865.1/:1-702(+)